MAERREHWGHPELSRPDYLEPMKRPEASGSAQLEPPVLTDLHSAHRQARLQCLVRRKAACSSEAGVPHRAPSLALAPLAAGLRSQMAGVHYHLRAAGLHSRMAGVHYHLGAAGLRSRLAGVHYHLGALAARTRLVVRVAPKALPAPTSMGSLRRGQGLVLEMIRRTAFLDPFASAPVPELWYRMLTRQQHNKATGRGGD